MVQFKFTEELKTKPFWRAVTAEVLGTGILIFLGVGSILLGTTPSPVQSSADIMRISFTFGFTVTCLVWTLGPVSGCHLNPAVSVAVFCIGRISLVRVAFYTLAQCVGSTLGTALVYFIIPAEKRGSMGASGLANGIESAQGFVCEVALTFILLMVICACVDEGRRDHGKGRATIPLTIGLTIIILNLMGIPYSGASLNPARSFGPAVVSGIWESHWIYWMGPIIGGSIGALVYHFMFSSKMHPEIIIRTASGNIPHMAEAKEPAQEPLMPTPSDAPPAIAIDIPEEKKE